MDTNVDIAQTTFGSCQPGASLKHEGMNNKLVTELIKYDECRQIIFYTCCTSLSVCLLSVLFNIANLRVFYKTGFKNQITICFFSLSVADLLSSLLYVDMILGSMEDLDETGMIISFRELRYFFGPAYIASSSMASWVTALISVERSVAIALPLKASRLITRKMVKGLILGMILYQIAVVIPNYSTMRLVSTVSPDTNKTRLVLDLDRFDFSVSAVSLVLSFSLPTLFSFVVIVASTANLTFHLRRTALGPLGVGLGLSVAQHRNRMVRNIKARRVSLIVCLVHLACFSPFLIIFGISISEPTFTPGDPYFGSLYFIMLRIAGLFHMVSCFVNFFIHLAVNSNFRKTLKACLV